MDLLNEEKGMTTDYKEQAALFGTEPPTNPP